jgi:hypothetical protein
VKRILNISIDIITGLLHNKVLISEQHFISSKMHFIGRANLSKRSRKDLKRAMPHLSVSMSKPFQKWHKMVSTKDKYKIVAEKLGIHQRKLLLWNAE